GLDGGVDGGGGLGDVVVRWLEAGEAEWGKDMVELAGHRKEWGEGVRVVWVLDVNMGRKMGNAGKNSLGGRTH
ncbi:hypothetical protein Tco_1286616, partial [Tanacetum coccineum]